MPGSLIEVIDAIPDSCYVQPTARGVGLVARDLAIYLGVIVALYFAHAWWLVGLLWLVTGFSIAGLFVLGHDAAHGALFANRRLNGVIGRMLMLPSLHLFDAWKLGHNHIHHRHTTKQGMDFVWHPVTPAGFAEMNKMHRLIHRLEWSMLGAGAYYLRNIWLKRMVMFTPPAKWVRGVNRDRLLVSSVAGVTTFGVLVLGGLFSGDIFNAVWLVMKLLVVPFLLFGWIIGWTVYVHHIDPRIPWLRKVGRRSRRSSRARPSCACPRASTSSFHWIFVHVPHHVDVRIPCYHLTRAAEAIKEAFPGVVAERKMRLGDYIRTTRAWQAVRLRHRSLVFLPARPRNAQPIASAIGLCHRPPSASARGCRAGW
jgi:omega-6 fatty acid desaturase (delta-12 desaturase)